MYKVVYREQEEFWGAPCYREEVEVYESYEGEVVDVFVEQVLYDPESVYDHIIYMQDDSYDEEYEIELDLYLDRDQAILYKEMCEVDGVEMDEEHLRSVIQ